MLGWRNLGEQTFLGRSFFSHCISHFPLRNLEEKGTYHSLFSVGGGDIIAITERIVYVSTDQAVYTYWYEPSCTFM